MLIVKSKDLTPNVTPNAILKPHRGGSVVEVARLRLLTFTVEIKELVEWFGLELCRIAVDECLPPL